MLCYMRHTICWRSFVNIWLSNNVNKTLINSEKKRNSNCLISSGCGYGAGFMVNYNDVAGAYSGLVFGIANTFGTVPGFVAPAIVGALTTHVTIFELNQLFDKLSSVSLFKKAITIRMEDSVLNNSCCILYWCNRISYFR